MRKKLLFTMLALSLGSLLGGSRAMAQNGWEAIYSQTQTTEKSWTAISESSKTGKVLGAEDATTYYYITESLDFTNSNAGGSGLKIEGTVYLYIPYGWTDKRNPLAEQEYFHPYPYKPTRDNSGTRRGMQYRPTH